MSDFLKTYFAHKFIDKYPPLGMDRAFISNIENGEMNPILATIVKLAKALGVPIEELIK